MADDGQGWHGDSKGHSEAAEGQSPSDGEGMFDKVTDALTGSNSEGGSDGRGWHGDSEGHSEAAKANDNSSTEEDGSDGDSQGRGWHGDSEGHSEAAQK